MKKIALIIAILAWSGLPLLASAQNVPNGQNLPNVWSITSIQGPLTTCVGNYLQGTGATVANPSGLQPCQTLCDLIYTIEWDIYVGIAFVIWIILPIMFIVAGIMYMMGGANPGLLTTAKSAIKGAVIGAIIVLCAYLLISTVVQTLKITGIGGFGSPACTLSAQTSSPSSGAGVASQTHVLVAQSVPREQMEHTPAYHHQAAGIRKLNADARLSINVNAEKYPLVSTAS